MQQDVKTADLQKAGKQGRDDLHIHDSNRTNKFPIVTVFLDHEPLIQTGKRASRPETGTLQAVLSAISCIGG